MAVRVEYPYTENELNAWVDMASNMYLLFKAGKVCIDFDALIHNLKVLDGLVLDTRDLISQFTQAYTLYCLAVEDGVIIIYDNDNMVQTRMI